VTDDDDLRARMRHADPAASLEPASPDQVAHLVEEAMSRKTRTWALPVAAALALIAAGIAWTVTRPDTPSPALQPVPATVVALTVTGAQAKCVEPKAAELAKSADFAFEGTVQKIENGRVRLAASQVFRGGPATEVEVSQADGSSEQMLGSGRFETGESYLVSAADGNVIICGYSGEADSPGLRELFEAAF
jgi:hypothetical protein